MDQSGKATLSRASWAAGVRLTSRPRPGVERHSACLEKRPAGPRRYGVAQVESLAADCRSGRRDCLLRQQRQQGIRAETLTQAAPCRAVLRRRGPGSGTSPPKPVVAVRPSWVAHHVAWAWLRLGYRRARAVDHGVDAARCVEEAGQDVVKLDAESAGDLERLRGEDGHPLVEEAVAGHPVALERLGVPGDLERRVAVGRAVGHPGRLARWF